MISLMCIHCQDHEKYYFTTFNEYQFGVWNNDFLINIEVQFVIRRKVKKIWLRNAQEISIIVVYFALDHKRMFNHKHVHVSCNIKYEQCIK